MNPIKIDNSNKFNFVNRITIIFLLTVIFEGAIRKWISNTYSLEIILFRDSLVIIGILYGFISSTYSKSGIPEKILIIWTILVLFWLILQIIFKDLNLFVGLVGIRNWILYLWFSILIYRGFDRNQLNYLIKILVVLSFPIILLGCFQYFSPIDSFINKPVVEGSFIFQFVDGVVRPSSFFTFTYGYTQFLFLIIPILFYFILFLQEKTNEKIFTYNSKKYYKSGDSGYIKDGFLFYNGRKSDNYKLTNGKFVNVNEIENIIKKYVHSNFIIFGENNSYNSIICDKSIDNNIINTINNNLDSFLKIKNVIIISEEEMNKFLTPKMSIKRNQLISYINNDYNKNIK